MISPIPAAVDTKPGSATKPFPGIHANIFDEEGNAPKGEAGGFLVVTHPWPGMLRGIWGRQEEVQRNLLEQIRRDLLCWRRRSPRQIWILLDHRTHRRRDEYFRPSHRYNGSRECAGFLSRGCGGQRSSGDPTRSREPRSSHSSRQRRQQQPTMRLLLASKSRYRRRSAQSRAPSEIRFTNALPKTRSGKIMRRLLRDIASGRDVAGDTSTLEDFSVLAKLRESDED